MSKINVTKYKERNGFKDWSFSLVFQIIFSESTIVSCLLTFHPFPKKVFNFWKREFSSWDLSLSLSLFRWLWACSFRWWILKTKRNPEWDSNLRPKRLSWIWTWRLRPLGHHGLFYFWNKMPCPEFPLNFFIYIYTHSEWNLKCIYGASKNHFKKLIRAVTKMGQGEETDS